MSKIDIGLKINNRYRLVSRVAQGGTAEVYEAYDIVNKRHCAVKFILESLIGNQDNVRRFTREASIAGKLSHPNIVKVYDSGVYENRAYIVLEYINGQTLGEKIKLGSKLTYIEICEIMIQMCDVLTYTHMHSIVHRDIKPDNIYCFYDGTVKLADFGIAIDLAHKTREDVALMGSVHYIAPELVARIPQISKQADIYSLGVTFYELVTRQVPFNDANPLNVALMHVNNAFPLPSAIANDLPKPIEKIILKATMKNLEERYQSARAMKEDLLEVLANKKKYTKYRSFFQRLFGFR